MLAFLHTLFGPVLDPTSMTVFKIKQIKYTFLYFPAADKLLRINHMHYIAINRRVYTRCSGRVDTLLLQGASTRCSFKITQGASTHAAPSGRVDTLLLQNHSGRVYTRCSFV
jgi:hypothetical protein